MNIRVIDSGGKIVMKLSGYLDALFAWQIVRKVENYKGKEVVLDFKGISMSMPLVGMPSKPE
ncbi:MAG: hypothetical protein JSW12_04050 [Deltaproteobacteria bacterium]|nr:MAG: hypothetical protein JSW12_04050 [Deltaproteobacteria bacterium]